MAGSSRRKQSKRKRAAVEQTSIRSKERAVIVGIKSKLVQYGPKALLWIAVISLVPLAWYGYERFAYYRHWQTVLPAISQLQQQGALLIYGNTSNERAEKPEWLRRMVGDLYPERILGIAFQGDCTAETLALLPQLNDLHIEIVLFNDCQLHADGLRYLRECKHLKRVKMVGGTLQGKGFDQVFLVPGLESFRLEESPLSPSNLSTLDQATQLQVLQLSKTSVAVEEMKRIGRLLKLRDLWLNDDELTTLAGLNGMKTLESLDLNGSTVSDAMLAELEQLPNLRQLTLSKTKVTAASIPLLKRFAKLESLAVDHLTLGPTELAALKAMPAFKSVVDFSDTQTIKP